MLPKAPPSTPTGGLRQRVSAPAAAPAAPIVVIERRRSVTPPQRRTLPAEPSRRKLVESPLPVEASAAAVDPSSYELDNIRADPSRAPLVACVVAAGINFKRMLDRRIQRSREASIDAAADASQSDTSAPAASPSAAAAPALSEVGGVPRRPAMRRTLTMKMDTPAVHAAISALQTPRYRGESLRRMGHAARVIALCLSYAQARRVHRELARRLLKERLVIAAILDENAAKGTQRLQEAAVRERVAEAEKKLEAVRPLLDTLTAGIDPAKPLSEWGGAECARLITNMQLPAYAESFERNLTGQKLMHLKIHHMPQLGVKPFEHQKALLRTLEQLTEALSAQAEEASVRAAWASLALMREQTLSKVTSSRERRRDLSSSSLSPPSSPERARPDFAASGAEVAQQGGGPGMWPEGFGVAMQHKRTSARGVANDAVYAASPRRKLVTTRPSRPQSAMAQPQPPASPCKPDGTTLSVRVTLPTAVAADFGPAAAGCAPAESIEGAAPLLARPMSARTQTSEATAGALYGRPNSARPVVRPAGGTQGNVRSDAGRAEGGRESRHDGGSGWVTPRLHPGGAGGLADVVFGSVDGVVSVRRLQARTAIELYVLRYRTPATVAVLLQAAEARRKARSHDPSSAIAAQRPFLPTPPSTMPHSPSPRGWSRPGSQPGMARKAAGTSASGSPVPGQVAASPTQSAVDKPNWEAVTTGAAPGEQQL